jgi:sulfatase modifying factor 1
MRSIPALLLAATAMLSASPALAAEPGPGDTFTDCADCVPMVVVPAGSFLMGSSEAERTREGVATAFGDHEKPQLTITFARPFAIAATETTVAQFATFVRETARPIPDQCYDYNPEDDSWAGTPGKKVSWKEPGFAQGDDSPAVCVSQQDGVAFAAWLSKKTGHHYRLPSEAEWEYAARAGTTTTRPWGEGTSTICQKAAIMTSATYEAIHHSEGWADELICAGPNAWTVPARSFDANPWGVYDMLGNVWEWVADCATDDHAGLPLDGKARTSGDCTKAITKGGAFHSRVWLARPATRGNGIDGTSHVIASGFRVVRDLD